MDIAIVVVGDRVPTEELILRHSTQFLSFQAALHTLAPELGVYMAVTKTDKAQAYVNKRGIGKHPIPPIYPLIYPSIHPPIYPPTHLHPSIHSSPPSDLVHNYIDGLYISIFRPSGCCV